MKIVYVTGCLGFIGSYVTKFCLKSGWHVRGVDKITYASNIERLNEFSKNNNFVFENTDINDLEWLYDCDYVINTAAETHVDNSIVKSDDFVHSNINGVHHLLELIRKKNNYKMPTLLHFSTDEVYGDIVNGSHKETDLLKPSNPYSATKAAADQLILAWARTYKVPYVIVRPANNYGIGQYVEKLIPKSCKLLSVGKKIQLHDGGEPYRMWLHAKDTANAIIKIIQIGVQNEIYNVTSRFEQKNIDTVKKILNLYLEDDTYNIDSYVDFGYKRDGQDVRYSIDDSKLRNLGWEETADFDEELKHIVRFYKNNFIW